MVLRWALAVRPRFLMLENVEEFRGWGPLLTDSQGKGQYAGAVYLEYGGIINKK
ncbi:hypothetical protein ACRASO_000312 [Yersinia enterocolitica]